jgi:hypothetical protein
MGEKAGMPRWLISLLRIVLVLLAAFSILVSACGAVVMVWGYREEVGIGTFFFIVFLLLTLGAIWILKLLNKKGAPRFANARPSPGKDE